MNVQISTGNPAARAILERHPHVDLLEGSTNHLDIDQSGWRRQVFEGNLEAEIYGLPEIMDNNPLVCSNAASTPGPAETLLLIAAGPLVRAGILTESPVFICSEDAAEENLARALESENWREGVSFRHEPAEIGSAAAGSLIASVKGISDPIQIKELFEEWYGPKFFVISGLGELWSPDLVLGTPFSYYKTSVSIDGDEALVKVQVLADREGKCGAAQLVHMMNIMCGFEESLPF